MVIISATAESVRDTEIMRLLGLLSLHQQLIQVPTYCMILPQNTSNLPALRDSLFGHRQEAFEYPKRPCGWHSKRPGSHAGSHWRER